MKAHSCDGSGDEGSKHAEEYPETPQMMIQHGVEQQMKRRKIKILSLTAHNYVHIGQENRNEDSSSPLTKQHLADGHAIRETKDGQEMRKFAAPPHGAEKTMGGCVSLGNGMPSSSSIPSPEDIAEKKRKSSAGTDGGGKSEAGASMAQRRHGAASSGQLEARRGGVFFGMEVQHGPCHSDHMQEKMRYSGYFDMRNAKLQQSGDALRQGAPGSHASVYRLLAAQLSNDSRGKKSKNAKNGAAASERVADTKRIEEGQGDKQSISKTAEAMGVGRVKAAEAADAPLLAIPANSSAAIKMELRTEESGGRSSAHTSWVSQCGHRVRLFRAKETSGALAGMWQLRLSGPSIPPPYKPILCKPSLKAALRKAAEYLNLSVHSFHSSHATNATASAHGLANAISSVFEGVLEGLPPVSPHPLPPLPPLPYHQGVPRPPYHHHAAPDEAQPQAHTSLAQQICSEARGRGQGERGEGGDKCGGRHECSYEQGEDGHKSIYHHLSPRVAREDGIGDAVVWGEGAAAVKRRSEARVFEGCVVYFDGTTGQHSSMHLSKLVMLYGGNCSMTLNKSKVTHVVCENLSASKTHKALHERSMRVRYVGPEWITHSIRRGKRLSEDQYLILHHSNQPCLHLSSASVACNTGIEIVFNAKR